METLVAFGIAFVVTLFFVRSYVKDLAGRKKPDGGNETHAAVVALETIACPRCGKPVPKGASFCNSCGAPLALWNVHRAATAVSTADPTEKGKPKPVINASLCIGCGSCVDVCPETGTLEMQGGKAILAHGERCTGHAKCVEVCPTSAITLAFGGVLQTLRVPLVRENFETNVDGIFIVGELSGVGLIKTAINEGRLVMDHIQQRLGQSVKAAGNGHGHSRDEEIASASLPHETVAPGDEPAEVLIVGSGPAGLSASLAAHQLGIRYITLEQGEVASTIRQYPWHKFLMAEPVEMPLYGSLYIADGTKESLVNVWENIIVNTGVKVHTNERVETVRREGDDLFVVETGSGCYLAKSVVLALGKRGSPRRLGVPGDDLSKVSYRLIEAESYEDKDILVVGGGDAAIEAALALCRDGRNRVTLSYRKESFSRARERNQAALLAAEKEGRATIFRRSELTEIHPESVTLRCEGNTVTLPNHFVFAMIGGESPEAFLRKVGIEIVEKTVGTPQGEFA